jgi:hypothetical protein
VRALVAAGLVAGMGYLGAESPNPLAKASEQPTASEIDPALVAGVMEADGDSLHLFVLDHGALSEGWRDLPFEERTRLIRGHIDALLAKRGVVGVAPQYGQVIRGIAADGALPMARSVEMLQVAGPGGPGPAHVCVAVPADPAAAEGVVASLTGSIPAPAAAAVPESEWRRFVAAHEIFHCLDFHERGVVWRQAQRFGMADAPPSAPAETERFADVAAAVWTFGSGPEAAAKVRAAADLRALSVARRLVEHHVVSFAHWTTPALDALADRLERGEGVGATGVAGAAALARTAVADVRGDGDALLAALPRLNDPAERPAGVRLDQVGAELRRLGAPEALAARIELAIARQGSLERLLPEPGSTGAGLLTMSALAADMPMSGQPDRRSVEGVGLAGADVTPMALPPGLSLDRATGLFVPAGDGPPLRAVESARADALSGLERDETTGLLLGPGDRALLDAVQAARAEASAAVPADGRSQDAAVRALDLMGREGVLSARFQSWGQPMDPLEQEEMRIHHAFQQEMARCHSLRTAANVLGDVFANRTGGWSWTLGQMGGEMAVRRCIERAQQTAEINLDRIRQIRQQREMARQPWPRAIPGLPGWGQPSPGAWGQQPAKGWSQAGQDGGPKAPEHPRRQHVR